MTPHKRETMMIFARTTLFVLILVIGFGIIMHKAYGHKAPSGMPYDLECCAEYDCAPVKKHGSTPNGTWTLTTKHGTAVYSPATIRKTSTDGQFHACIVEHSEPRLKCIYVPGLH